MRIDATRRDGHDERRRRGVGRLQRFEQPAGARWSPASSPGRSAAPCSPSRSRPPSSARSTTPPRSCAATARLVPNDFHVELSQTDYDRLSPYDSALARELTAQVQRARRAAGYVFAGPVDDRLRRARRPDHRAVPGPQPGDGQRAPARRPAPTPQVAPRARAFLEVNGDPAPAATAPGWSSAAAPRPTCASTTRASPGGTPRSGSRPAHRRRPGGTARQRRDLGSTNGMLVDGHRVSQRARHRRLRRSSSATPR